MKFKSLVVLSTFLMLMVTVSCTKGKSCMARNASGDEIFGVNGEENCTSQINAGQSEWCDCGSVDL